MRSLESFKAFILGFSEVRHVLRMAECESQTIEPGGILAPQQMLTRAAIVLLCAHVEAFFESASSEFVDGLVETDPWFTRSVGVKGFVSIHIRDELQLAIQEVGECVEERRTDAFRERVMKSQLWFDDLGLFKAEATKPRLRGFYRDHGPKAIDKLLRRLLPFQSTFYDWLEVKGHDRSRFWVSMDGLVKGRNAVAHGDQATSFTVSDVRSYAAVSIVTIRQACRYLS
jgi:hypothetical protein